jgi:tetratricopeptide (TPR) repeat protein
MKKSVSLVLVLALCSSALATENNVSGKPAVNSSTQAENDKMMADLARQSVISGIVDIVIGPITTVFTGRTNPPLKQKMARIYLSLGRLAYLKNNKLEALRYSYRVTQLDPENSQSWEQLKDLLEKAGDFGKTQHDKTEIAIAYKHLGQFQLSHYTPGNPEKVLQFYQKAASLDKTVINQQDMATVYRKLADSLINIEPEKGIESYQRALKLHEAAGNKKGMVEVCLRIGDSYMSQANDRRRDQKTYELMDKGFEFYLQAFNINKALGNQKGMAENYATLAVAYFQYGGRDGFDTGVEMYQQAIKLNEALGDKNTQAQNYSALGYFYAMFADKTTEAKYNYQKSLELYQQLGDASGAKNIQLEMDKLK